MKKTVSFFGVLLLILCAGGILFLRMADGSITPQIEVVKGRVLALARDIIPGEFLEARDLHWVEWQGDASAQNFYFLEGVNTPESLSGVIIKEPLKKNEMLKQELVIRPGEAAFLTVVLRKGMRAFTIQVDTVTGGAGLIRPGNRVDVILSGKFGSGAAGYRGFASAQTLLTDVEVIAVDKDFEQIGIRAKTEEENRSGYRGKGTVTLEVNPKEVELLTVASSAGTLSLSLRNLFELGDGVAPTGNVTTAAEIISADEKAAIAKPVVTLYGIANKQR